MGGKKDLRIVRTYSLLFQAFEELIAEKGYDDITISELCERAMVRRATFYSHFSDKSDFVSTMLRQMQYQYAQETRSQWTAVLQQMEDRSSAVPVLEVFLRYALTLFSRHRALLLGLMREGSYVPEFVESMTVDPGSIDPELEQFAERLRDELLRNLDGEIAEQFAIGALSQSMMWWLEHGDDSTIAETAKRISELVQRLITPTDAHPEGRPAAC